MNQHHVPQRGQRYTNPYHMEPQNQTSPQQFHQMQPLQQALPQAHATYPANDRVHQFQQPANNVPHLSYQPMPQPQQIHQYYQHPNYHQPHIQPQSRVTIYIQRPSRPRSLIVQRSNGPGDSTITQQPSQTQQFDVYQQYVQADQQSYMSSHQQQQYYAQSQLLPQGQRPLQPQQPRSRVSGPVIARNLKQTQNQHTPVLTAPRESKPLEYPRQTIKQHDASTSVDLEDQPRPPVQVLKPAMPATDPSPPQPATPSPKIKPPTPSIKASTPLIEPSTPSEPPPIESEDPFDNAELDLSRQSDAIVVEDLRHTITPFSDRNKLILLAEHLAKEISFVLKQDATKNGRHAKRLYVSTESTAERGHRHELLIKRPKLRLSWNKCEEGAINVALLERLVELPVYFEWYHMKAHLDCFMKAHVVAQVEDKFESDSDYQLALARDIYPSLDNFGLSDEVEQPAKQVTQQPISKPCQTQANASRHMQDTPVRNISHQVPSTANIPINSRISVPKITENPGSNSKPVSATPEVPKASMTPRASETPRNISTPKVKATPKGPAPGEVIKPKHADTPQVSSSRTSRGRGRPRKVVASPRVVKPTILKSSTANDFGRTSAPSQVNLSQARPVTQAAPDRRPFVPVAQATEINECIILCDDSEDELQIVYDNCSSSAKKIFKKS